VSAVPPPSPAASRMRAGCALNVSAEVVVDRELPVDHVGKYHVATEIAHMRWWCRTAAAR